MNQKGPNLFVTAVFCLAITFLYLPLAYLILQAFLKDPAHLDGGFTLHWIAKLFESGALWEPLGNSLFVAILSATLAVTIGTAGAVGLTKFRNEQGAIIQTLIMLPILLPEVITGLSLLLFFLVIHIPLGMGTVILAHASFSASFVYFIMVEQLRKLDPQMGEAASDLGAPPESIFWMVTLPNILPGMLGGWLLAFTLSFDDFLISFFTSGAGLTTLPLKIYSLMRVGVSPELNGLSLLMILLSSGLVLALLSKEKTRKWVLRS